jgi:hypothetical protein
MIFVLPRRAMVGTKRIFVLPRRPQGADATGRRNRRGRTRVMVCKLLLRISLRLFGDDMCLFNGLEERQPEGVVGARFVSKWGGGR